MENLGRGKNGAGVLARGGLLASRSCSRGSRRATRLVVRLGLVVSLGLLVGSRAVLADDALPEVVVTQPGVPGDAGPASVSTLTRDDIDGGTIQGTADLSARAPGLSVRVSGDRKSPFVSLRGLTNTFTGDTAVGLYVDDVPYADIRGQLIDLYDV